MVVVVPIPSSAISFPCKLIKIEVIPLVNPTSFLAFFPNARDADVAVIIITGVTCTLLSLKTIEPIPFIHLSN